MSEFKTLPKPIKQERKDSWGVKRKYSKPKKFVKILPIKVKPEWTEDQLLEPPYRGHYLFEVTPLIAQQVINRANGKCENPDCDNKPQEMNHIVGHSRRAHAGNINYLCIQCHRGKNGFHSFGEFYKYCMKKYQDWCFNAGYNREQVVFLLAKKDGRLF